MALSATPANLPVAQKSLVGLAAILAVAMVFKLYDFQAQKALVFAIGLGMGLALYHAAFGFTGAYRRAIVEKDLSGITAQAIMLALPWCCSRRCWPPVKCSGTVSVVPSRRSAFR
jgi:hypothetical protein